MIPNNHHLWAINILRVGLAITFLWVGVLIFRDPELWGGLLKPWAAGLLPVPLRQAMIGTAALDLTIGFLFLVDRLVVGAALVGLLHLIIVLVTVGIDVVTFRDLGLAAGCLALAVAYLPARTGQPVKNG